MIKAIIFDFDGLIVDTETPWFEAYRDVYEEYGVEMPLEIWAKCVGASFDVFNPIIFLEEQLKRSVDQDDIRKRTKDKFDVYMAEQELRPGVRQYLDEARQLGLRISLASSSTRAWVGSYLRAFELESYFESIHTADDVARVKPDPELYLKALAGLGLQGDEAIAFEDSHHGSKAAKAAGLYCVAVPNSVTSFMDFGHVDLRIKSMEATSLREVLATIASK